MVGLRRDKGGDHLSVCNQSVGNFFANRTLLASYSEYEGFWQKWREKKVRKTGAKKKIIGTLSKYFEIVGFLFFLSLFLVS